MSKQAKFLHDYLNMNERDFLLEMNDFMNNRHLFTKEEIEVIEAMLALAED